MYAFTANLFAAAWVTGKKTHKISGIEPMAASTGIIVGQNIIVQKNFIHPNLGTNNESSARNLSIFFGRNMKPTTPGLPCG